MYAFSRVGNTTQNAQNMLPSFVTTISAGDDMFKFNTDDTHIYYYYYNIIIYIYVLHPVGM